MEIQNKNVVITGASSGIGLETLKLFLNNNCNVVVCARKIENINIKSDNLFIKKVDVSKKEEIDEFFDFALDKLGNIDIFFANAGFAYYEKIEKADWEHAKYIIDTNVMSPIYAAEKMKEINKDRPYNFVVTASAMGLLSLPGYSLYSGTKAMLRGFADAYRYELNKDQHFQVVYPIATKTKFFERAAKDTPVPFPAQNVDSVAKHIIKGIKKDKKHIFPSTTFRIMNAVNRVLPFIFKIYVSASNKDYRKWQERKNHE